MLAVLAALAAWRFPLDRAQRLRDPVESFKYGSIGSDVENGLPLKLLLVLPRVFPEHLPEGAPRDLTAFGFLREPGRDRPIGFSRRRRLIDLTGLNCAACHVGEVRGPEGEGRLVILGMPAAGVDLMAFFRFLFTVAADDRFRADVLLPAIEETSGLGPVEGLLYRLAIPRVREELLLRRVRAAALFAPGRPAWGPGRVDTFNPYKVLQFAAAYREGLSERERVGVADFPPLWNQQARRGMQLHWDGNNRSLAERNLSAALGAGATPASVDLDGIRRVARWALELPPPTYPYPVDRTLAARGREIYRRLCADCHDPDGSRTGTVVPLGEIGTDGNRLRSYTEKLAALQRAYTQGYEWAFRHFRKTEGYAAMPLDGVWARAPYLHNGSVPTLWRLLTPEERPAVFWRGSTAFDEREVGFAFYRPTEAARPLFRFEAAIRGNGNRGHEGPAYGTELDPGEKWALIEYLKTR